MTGWLAQWQDNISEWNIESWYRCPVSLCDSTIKSLWLHTVTSQYLSYCDLECCQDVKLQCLSRPCNQRILTRHPHPVLITNHNLHLCVQSTAGPPFAPIVPSRPAEGSNNFGKSLLAPHAKERQI